MPTPPSPATANASYGVFNQGPVYCLALDGKLLWGFRDQVMRDNRGTFHQSPTLCKGLLLDPGLQQRETNGFSTMRAFEAKTGKIRWESPFPGSNYTVPRVVHLARPTGEVVPVLMGNGPGCPIQRIADALKVGELSSIHTARGLDVRGASWRPNPAIARPSLVTRPRWLRDTAIDNRQLQPRTGDLPGRSSARDRGRRTSNHPTPDRRSVGNHARER